MSLKNHLGAPGGAYGKVSHIDAYLLTLNADECAEARAALALESGYTNAALVKALAAEGVTVSESAVRNYRIRNREVRRVTE